LSTSRRSIPRVSSTPRIARSTLSRSARQLVLSPSIASTATSSFATMVSSPCLPPPWMMTDDVGCPEFAFYVNKNGWRAKSNWIIQWEGFPTSFGTSSPPPCLLILTPPSHSIALPLRPRLRAHFLRGPPRRIRRSHADHTGQQPPLPLRRHPTLRFLRYELGVLPIRSTGVRIRRFAIVPVYLSLPFFSRSVRDHPQ
jgi:hypothetical protein